MTTLLRNLTLLSGSLCFLLVSLLAAQRLLTLDSGRYKVEVTTKDSFLMVDTATGDTWASDGVRWVSLGTPQAPHKILVVPQ